ncbi:Uncharacterised protein [Achromobacter ruhlandii]|nr:Uncharacterised protein [Achromobacter ruhlandii]
MARRRYHGARGRLRGLAGQRRGGRQPAQAGGRHAENQRHGGQPGHLEPRRWHRHPGATRRSRWPGPGLRGRPHRQRPPDPGAGRQPPDRPRQRQMGIPWRHARRQRQRSRLPSTRRRRCGRRARQQRCAGHAEPGLRPRPRRHGPLARSFHRQPQHRQQRRDRQPLRHRWRDRHHRRVHPGPRPAVPARPPGHPRHQYRRRRGQAQGPGRCLAADPPRLLRAARLGDAPLPHGLAGTAGRAAASGPQRRARHRYPCRSFVHHAGQHVSLYRPERRHGHQDDADGRRIAGRHGRRSQQVRGRRDAGEPVHPAYRRVFQRRYRQHRQRHAHLFRLCPARAPQRVHQLAIEPEKRCQRDEPGRPGLRWPGARGRQRHPVDAGGGGPRVRRNDLLGGVLATGWPGRQPRDRTRYPPGRQHSVRPCRADPPWQRRLRRPDGATHGLSGQHRRAGDGAVRRKRECGAGQHADA